MSLELLSSENQSNLKKICIIGGGPSGLCCLKVITDTPEFKAGLWTPVIFESREKLGGVWFPAPATTTTSPPLSSLYDSLTTNIPHPIMAFTSFSFPPSTPVYPPAAVVQPYLESFVSHFRLSPYIRLRTTVEQVERDPSNSLWRVRLSTNETLDFDYVVVANGHYNIPRYPNLPGLDKWLEAGRASHSAWYRRPQDMGQVILVVGGGPSGQDITDEMCSAARIVIHSTTRTTTTTTTTTSQRRIPNLQIRGRVVEFFDDGKVAFDDGTVEQDIDHCILATGYEINFPFFSEDSVIKSCFSPPVPPLLPSHVCNSTYHVFPLIKHLFPLQSQYPPTSLAFPGLLYRVAPFPLVEAQAHVMVKAWSHPESINLAQEAQSIITRYERFTQQCGGDELRIAKTFFRFEPMEQFDYRDELYGFAFAGDEQEVERRKVPAWQREMYRNKGILRETWVQMERDGEAEEFVRGVGDQGWEDLMWRLLARAQQRHNVEDD